MNPSILSTKALIATMNTGAWRATKLHKDETAKVNTQHHADDVARVSVTITAHSALEGINKLHAKARQDHYRITLPCGDEGWRFLPCGREMEHSDMMLAYRSEHDKLVNEFMADYANEKATAPQRLNGLYRPEFFPPEDEVRARFKFATRYLPVPDKGTWQDWLREAADEAEEDLRTRLRDALTAASSRLGKPDAIFRDSLIGNIAEICELAPDLNMTDAHDIRIVAEAAHAELADLDPDTLRQCPDVRATAADRAARLASILG